VGKLYTVEQLSQKVYYQSNVCFRQKKTQIQRGKVIIRNILSYSNKKPNETIYKDGENKICFAKPQEQRLEVLDCECEAQTIDHFSNIYELCPATEDDNLNHIQIRRQRQVVESSDLLEDETICLNSEVDPQPPIEEVKTAFGLETFTRSEKSIQLAHFYIRRKIYCSINVV
jgi:hypothetical protein